MTILLAIWLLKWPIALMVSVIAVTSRVEASTRQSIADPTMPARIEKGTSA